MVVSFANKIYFINDDTLHISVIYVINNLGPSIDPIEYHVALYLSLCVHFLSAHTVAYRLDNS